ncbi:hypothetical protein ABL78_4595 [Leptomonas seymouri]|uniref:Uncharacterized protein n=1 Tax=Leptomonas seymouri TaxID=5684 RepID=A0A0N0P5D3_LEPSE|nr:hypothetical protein ABL78_4595 [Leptomonas seymouri]|eukprot:KPI86329.1 hypothetical protein ABL78_4595 [Leptomonas seymouri]
MANFSADPTSIDYILQRAQDELRRGENQHCRATEAQYTNHVKELLGNLERYLETCGVQLPAEVITGSKVMAAAAATLNEASVLHEVVRSPFDSQLKGGAYGCKQIFLTPYNYSIPASTALNNARGRHDSMPGRGAAGNGSCVSENAHPRAGWGTLATPTEAQQQLGRAADVKESDFVNVSAVAPIRRDKPEPATGGLMTSLGSINNHSPVSPKLRPGKIGRFLSTSVDDRSWYNESGSGPGNCYVSQQHMPLQMVSSPSPHPLQGRGAANPTVATSDTTLVCEGHSIGTVCGSLPLGTTIGSPLAEGKNGSANVRGSPLPLRQQQQRTPHAEPLVHGVTSRPHAEAGSESDPWGDFGHFVQSITESRINSNLTSMQSAAAATYSAPTNLVSSSDDSHARLVTATTTTATRNHESTRIATATSKSTATSNAGVVPPTAKPEAGFQLPYVLVTATSPISVSTKDLHPAQQQQRRSAHRSTCSPLSADYNAFPSEGHPESGSAQDESEHFFQGQPTTTTDVTSISSRSPSLPLQAAFGAGSNAVRALIAATTETDEGVERPIPKDGLHFFLTQVAPVEHAPSPPRQRHFSNPQLQFPAVMAAVPVQRAASLPTADCPLYKKGGSPYFPHILRVCLSAASTNPRTLLSSPSQPIWSTSPPHLPQQQQCSEAQGAEDTVAKEPLPIPPSPRRIKDAEVTVRSQEKEQLMRRLRGILNKSSSPPATPSVFTAFISTGGHSPSANRSGAVPWEAKTRPAIAPGVATASLSEEVESADEGMRAIATEAPRVQNRFRTVGVIDSPVYVQRSSLPLGKFDAAEEQCGAPQSSCNACGTTVNTAEEFPRAQHVSSPSMGTGGPSSGMRLSDIEDVHGGIASRVAEVGRYATAPTSTTSTAAPHYSFANRETPVSVAYETASVKGVGMDVHNRYCESNKECSASAARGRDGSPLQSIGETHQEKKQQLMQRLRRMLSRPDA